MYERLSASLQDVARFGIVDGPSQEVLRITYFATRYPTLVIIDQGEVFRYSFNASSIEQEELSLKQFISFGFQDSEAKPLQPKAGSLMLGIARVLSYLPQVADKLDGIIFERIGMTHLDPVAKVFMTFGLGMAVLGISLIALIYYCFGPNGAHGKPCEDC